MSFTVLERKVFNEIASTSMDGGVADIKDLISAGFMPSTVRGVLASLVKKGKIYVEECEPNGVKTVFYWPIYGECHGGFLCDYYGSEELASILL